jgi:MarR family transcriptional regulator, organic hydroperoxide resistance regulator
MYIISMASTPTPGYLLWRVATKWRAAVDRAVAPLGLTNGQYSLLASLYGMTRSGDAPSQRRLADHTGLEPLFVSKLARALEARGLLERAPDPDDSRAVRLTLTPRGCDVARQAIAIVHELHEKLLADLGGRDSERTRHLVSTLQRLLQTPLP